MIVDLLGNSSLCLLASSLLQRDPISLSSWQVCAPQPKANPHSTREGGAGGLKSQESSPSLGFLGTSLQEKSKFLQAHAPLSPRLSSFLQGSRRPRSLCQCMFLWLSDHCGSGDGDGGEHPKLLEGEVGGRNGVAGSTAQRCNE